jgi:hypothetical protein
VTDDEKRKIVAQQIAASLGWDSRPVALRDRLVELLEAQVADPGTEIDTGQGASSADLWVKVDGVEYFVTVQVSLAQRQREEEAARRG